MFFATGTRTRRPGLRVHRCLKFLDLILGIRIGRGHFLGLFVIPS
jgi:hypothetical protein